MKVILDENGFVQSYAIVGSFGSDSVSVNEPEDLSDFENHYSSYFMFEGKLIKDENRQVEIENTYLLNDLRKRREKECFPYINRGEFWYGRLSDIQREELMSWYDAWLNVTETKVVPESPDWIDSV